MIEKSRKNKKNKDFCEIVGVHAVKAALNNPQRIHQKIIISQNLRNKFINLEKKVNEIVYISNDKFNKIYGSEKNHQGIILKTSKIKQPSIDEIIFESKNCKSYLVIMLDQVTDPQNIGSIMRSCALFNCKSIIVTKNNSPEITQSMTKAASGALEIVNYLKVTNLSRVIKKFKKNNFWVIGFENNKNNNFNNFELSQKSLLIFGSENKGLRELTKKECDSIVNLPVNINNTFDIESLNVSNACTIALYEHYKTFKS